MECLSGHAGKRGGLHSGVAEEVETAVERLIGEGVIDAFQAIETEARRVSAFRAGLRTTPLPARKPALRAHLGHNHQARLRRVALRLRRPQDDHGPA